MGKKNNDSSDSEYEQDNLKQMLTKKRNKGSLSMNVHAQVEKRLAKKKAQQFIRYGQRSQHL